MAHAFLHIACQGAQVHCMSPGTAAGVLHSLHDHAFKLQSVCYRYIHRLSDTRILRAAQYC